MKTTRRLMGLLLTVVMLLSVCATGAEAVMKDFGPLNIYGFPSWYRDNNGLAVQQCLSRAISPVSALPLCNILPNPDSNPPFDATQPITFPPNPPTGYNFPDESFYYSISPDGDTFSFAAGRGRIVVVLALEAAFNVGDPIPGDQVVFSRVRVYLTQDVPDGNYKITHPYGVENLTVTGGLLRYTRDIGIAGVAFTGPLAGDVGPFFAWTVDPARVIAGIQNPDGTLNGIDPLTSLPGGQVFLGDPNFPHTFSGSPFGTNYWRCDGPVGSGIGGPGIDFIETNLGLIEGWKYTTPIPSKLNIDRLTYRRDALNAQIDVFATADQTSNQNTPSSLTITGANLAPLVMTSNGAGKFFSHITSLLPNQIPPQLTITNTSDNQAVPVIGDVVDEVVISEAVFEPNIKSLTIRAASGDLLNNPALSAEGFGPLASGILTIPALDVPPATVKVLSAAHGTNQVPVLVRTLFPPLAVDDADGVATGGSVAINVLANDTATAPATIDPTKVVIVSSPAHGTAVVNPATGVITYTPDLGPDTGDSFTYTVRDSNNIISNVAIVNIAISVINVAPVANNDTGNAVAGTQKNIALLINDTSATSTLNPDSIAVSNLTVPPGSSTASVVANVNGTGTVSFTGDVPGIYTFQYTVTDQFPGTPLTSNPATVTVTVVAPNVPPVAVADSAALFTGNSVLINLIGNDSDPDGAVIPASLVIASAPGNGTVTNNLNGTVTYFPASGFVGADSFTYNVQDNQGAISNNATVSITVNPPTDETLTITRAQYTLSTRTWRIDGNTTARVNGQKIRIFNSALVPGDLTTGLIAEVNVAANGSWTLSQVNPVLNTSRRISFHSSLGATNRENVTVTVR
ncbi:MAG TPA: hypothetical protein DER40_09995 [Geobacter sp.]|nr:hypothetical protein [Geobacter sp.]